MCDVLDLSVRCPSTQLPPLDNAVSWTTATSVDVDTAPWTTGNHVRHYQLEPISPCSSSHSPLSDSPPPPLRPYVGCTELDDFCQRRPVLRDQAQHDRPSAADRWSSDVPVTSQPSTSSMRRWNGDDGHPYSPLKRVLHQYRNGLVQDSELTVPVLSNMSNSSRTESPEKPQDQVHQPVSMPATSASAAPGCKKPTTTTASNSGMTFEEFVLGMLSKVGGGKAITAATQSYLRESAAATATLPTSSSSSNSMSETRTPSGVDVVQKTPRYDEHLVPSPTVYQTPDNRRFVGPLGCSVRDYSPSPFQYHLPSRPPAASDTRLLPPQPPASMMRRPAVRPDASERDDAYRERRRKNNEAAKRSRDTRRLKELQVASQAERLAEENLQLKAEIAVLRSQLGYLHRMMLDNNNGPHLNGSSSSSSSSNVNVNSAVEEGRPDDHHDITGHHYPHEDNGRTV